MNRLPVYCLLVDDLEENLLSLEALLRQENVVILKARSGREALEMLLHHDVALALLDVQMPEMDGFELAELMRGTERTRQVPIIFLTAGNMGRERRFRGYEAGAVDFLHKPVEPDILRSKAEVFFSLDRHRRMLSRQRDELLAAAEANAMLLQESRQYAEALKAADRRKDEFLANMSHEIRTPMNAIIGLSNILAMSKPLTDKQREFISTLQTSGHSLLNLINDLLDISKIESNAVELEQVPFSLTQVVQDAIHILTVRAQEKGLTLTMSQSGDAKLATGYIGDPQRIRQIVLNLCSNALKFTERGGVNIALSCHVEADGSHRVRMAVEDTGIGIAPEKLGRIFDKFVQADSSISRKYGGTGLGLAITKTLSERMGGDIEVTSVAGEGSVFAVTLPLPLAQPDAVQEIATPAAESATTMPRHRRLLLVEDHAPNVLVARTFLEGFGYEVDLASNGAQACSMSEAHPYLAILMDVQMPGMSGFEATQAIRTREAQKHEQPSYIIGMTAHALIGDRERCIEAGMDDYITKPFDPLELEEKLAVLCDRANAA